MGHPILDVAVLITELQTAVLGTPYQPSTLWLMRKRLLENGLRDFDTQLVTRGYPREGTLPRFPKRPKRQAGKSQNPKSRPNGGEVEVFTRRNFTEA